jgi:hypothetical protein
MLFFDLPNLGGSFRMLSKTFQQERLQQEAIVLPQILLGRSRHDEPLRQSVTCCDGPSSASRVDPIRPRRVMTHGGAAGDG